MVFLRIAMLALVGVGSSMASVDLSQYRTDKVKNELDMSKAEGFWYEVMYADIAQVGASCQTMNNTFDGASGKLEQKFKTFYVDNIVPFSQTYTYKPDASGTMGLYKKYLHGAQALLTLPTVIVDVTDGSDGRYERLIEYTVKSVVGITHVSELRFSARTKEVDDDTLQQMLDVCTALNIDAKMIERMKKIDHSACKEDGAIAV
jgi:hypothetical protein